LGVLALNGKTPLQHGTPVQAWGHTCPSPIQQFVTPSPPTSSRSYLTAAVCSCLSSRPEASAGCSSTDSRAKKELGVWHYPEVPLAEARKRRDDAKEKLAASIDPGESKKAEKRTQRFNAENSFEAIPREWHAKYATSWSDGHAARILCRLEVDAFAWIGGRPMAALAPTDVLDVLREWRSAAHSKPPTGSTPISAKRAAMSWPRAAPSAT
jgi:hypothetical protein